LLITIDTLRPDRVSAYGYTKEATAAIDSLATQGVLFEQAVCDIPWTTGSMASVMTGTLGARHGVRLRTQRLAESNLTLAEILGARRYRTGAVVGSFPVAAVYGLNQGFESYDDEFTRPILAAPDGAWAGIRRVPTPAQGANRRWMDEKMRNDAFRPDHEVSTRAIEWLKAHHASPFFLWVHYFGPHERLRANSLVSQQEPRIIADYDEDLRNTDEAVGRLLVAVRQLSLEDRLLVVLHADHGQSLGEHSYVGHGEDLYDASIRIPLLMRFAERIAAGGRVRQLVRNVDVMSTVLDLLGVPAPAALDGRSLVPAIEGNELPAAPASAATSIATVALRPLAMTETGIVLGPMEQWAFRTERWKYIEDRLSRPCVKGTAAYRGDPPGTDRWGLREAAVLAPDECDRLRVDELYDLPNDPHEVRNVAAAHPDVVEELRHALQTAAQASTAEESMHLSARDRERLRSLGYQTGDE